MLAAHTLSETSLADDLNRMDGVRVFFGHHSVGRDILDGVDQIVREIRIGLHIEGAPLADNGSPLHKIADFEDRTINGAADVALMKLCFVDFTPDTNVEAIFDAYASSVARIRVARPQLRLVHVTPPLHARQEDLKSRLNRALGRVVWEDQANKKRMELAEELRTLFAREPIFDLAKIESTRPDGTREVHVVDDRQVPMMWPGYTTDGGHLSPLGKTTAARGFVRALAGALR